MRQGMALIAATTFLACAAMFLGQWSLAGDPPGVGVAGSGSPSVAAAPGGAFTAQPISSGHDAIIGAITGPTSWGGLNGIAAYSFGPTMCNTGTLILSAVASTNQHAAWGSNLYRISTVDGATRIEQIGQGWLMHQFCALQQGLCGACQSCGGGCPSCLGVGCSVPETSSRAGAHNLLGPRFQVNASTGAFPYPATALGITGNVLFKRVQVATADLDPALNPGAVYRAETFLAHPQDGAAGNTANNVSHIGVNVGALLGTAPNQYYALSMAGATVRELPVVHAWKTVDPTVTITPVDVPGDGRFLVASDATNLGFGRWHYEYAIFNVSSHRSGQAFTVPIGPRTIITNIGFHDVNYHSQDVLPVWAQVDNVDWSVTVTTQRDVPNHVTWSTSAYSGAAPDGNEHTANALRFGTTYNFRFDADASPVMRNARLALFRPGTPTEVVVTIPGPGPAPPCPADLDGSATVNGLDLAILLGAWGLCAAKDCPGDLSGDGMVNGIDIAILLGAWGPCR